MPTSQSFLNYVLLAIVYGITMILRKRALKVALYTSPFFRSFWSLNDMIVVAFGFKEVYLFDGLFADETINIFNLAF